MPDGTCQQCPAYEVVSKLLSATDIECERPKCGPREKILIDGRCEICPDFHVVSDDGIDCVMPTCLGGAKITSDGTC